MANEMKPSLIARSLAHMELKVNEKLKAIYCVFLAAMITDISFLKLPFNLSWSEH